MSDEYVEVKIMVSREAYERAAQLAMDEKGPAGELAGMMDATDFIQCLVEIHLEQSPKHPLAKKYYVPPKP